MGIRNRILLLKCFQNQKFSDEHKNGGLIVYSPQYSKANFKAYIFLDNWVMANTPKDGLSSNHSVAEILKLIDQNKKFIP